jgi:hypothetical protein
MTQETRRPWDHQRLRRWFTAADRIAYNYAQSDQDIFVLSLLDGLEQGTYLEIGAGWPEHINNTALLEFEFGWRGISLDYQDQWPSQWVAAGRNTLVQANGLQVDFQQLLCQQPRVIDYLSVDCEPGTVSLEILKRLPWDQHQFKVITFEHECYAEGPAVKLASRQFLHQQGYQLVADNISHIGLSVDYEDWWVHPALVDSARLQAHLCVDNTVKNYSTYLYK